MSWEEKLKEIVRKCMWDNWPGHDYFHAMRVYNLCLRLGEKLNVDLDVLKAAALLHDVAYRENVEDHDILSAEMAEKILKDIGFPREKIGQVVYCIKSHRFLRGRKAESLEAKILQDADRLDAIGAIGIARALADAGLRKEKIWIPWIKPKEKYNGKSDSCINHFYEKLLKIKDNLNLKESKMIAEGRTRFMEMFLEEFFKEWKGEK
ncbi:MAG: HD domain-containing protein [Candidatus Baldrarchaeia archaeon]